MVSVDEILARVRAKQAAAAGIQLNAEQQAAVDKAGQGKSFCLVGAAGTGKTTVTKQIAQYLVANHRLGLLTTETKYLKKDSQGIVFVSFTRRAVRNLRKAMPKDLEGQALTIHKLLEFAPVFYETIDSLGEPVKTMRFEPTKTRHNPLPHGLTTVIVDESSMVSTELFALLLAALPLGADTQFIFIGDLHQLPPVYGNSILGFKLLDLPVVELTQIYRQAAQSPIISLAHRIKNGDLVPLIEKWSESVPGNGTVHYHPWKKRISQDDALRGVQAFFKELCQKGQFDPEEDVILCPFNINFGTIELNRSVAQALGQQRKEPVWEIQAGFKLQYLSVGDRVLHDREDYVIEKIVRNGRYLGKRTRPESMTLDRWGTEQSSKAIAESKQLSNEEELKAAEDYLIAMAGSMESPDDKTRKLECSHIIDLRNLDDDSIITLSSAAEVGNLIFSYALTVHKSQGSEWRRVFFVTHDCHAKMCSRELVYTAVTRAREELYIITEPDRKMPGLLARAAMSPRIKGNTLAAKIQHFAAVRKANEEEQISE